jgi:hypothetical protein
MIFPYYIYIAQALGLLFSMRLAMGGGPITVLLIFIIQSIMQAYVKKFKLVGPMRARQKIGDGDGRRHAGARTSGGGDAPVGDGVAGWQFAGGGVFAG